MGPNVARIDCDGLLQRRERFVDLACGLRVTQINIWFGALFLAAVCQEIALCSQLIASGMRFRPS